MAETVLNQQESKIEQPLSQQDPKANIKKIIGIVLFLVMVALTLFVINLQHQNNSVLVQSSQLALSASDQATNNYRTYVGRYKETKIELDETTRKLEEVNRQLNLVSAELASTKGMLNQTQGMLTQAQEENIKLKQQLQGLDALRTSENVQSIGQLESKIKTLKENNSQVSEQLVDLKNQLRAFEAQFSNAQEGQSLIVLFQNKIRLVKSRMHFLRQEAYSAKKAAQKEKDRLALLNGNSGFVLRNGTVPNVNNPKKSFAIDVKIVQ